MKDNNLFEKAVKASALLRAQGLRGRGTELGRLRGVDPAHRIRDACSCSSSRSATASGIRARVETDREAMESWLRVPGAGRRGRQRRGPLRHHLDDGRAGGPRPQAPHQRFLGGRVRPPSASDAGSARA